MDRLTAPQENKKELREKFDRDTAEYLARGGVIEQVPTLDYPSDEVVQELRDMLARAERSNKGRYAREHSTNPDERPNPGHWGTTKYGKKD